MSVDVAHTDQDHRRQVDEYLTAVEAGAVRPSSPPRLRVVLRGYERCDVGAYIKHLASDMGGHSDRSAIDLVDPPR